MQMNKWVWHSLLAQAAFILAIKNNDLLANLSSTYWAPWTSFAWAICSLYPFLLQPSTSPPFFSFSFWSLGLPLRPFTPCRPWFWAASLWDRLNLTKLIFRRRRWTTTVLLPFFFLSSWDTADISRWETVSYWKGWEERETVEQSPQLRVQSIPQGPGSHIVAWQLSMSFHWQIMTSHLLIMSHCSPKGVSSH